MAQVSQEKTPKVTNTDESPASEEQTSQEDINLVEKVKTKIDDKEVTIGYNEDGEMLVEELPEGVENEEEFLEKVKNDARVQELGRTLSKYKTERTRQNELLKDYDTLKEKSTLLAEKVAKYEKDLAERQKEIELLKASKEKEEYLKTGMNYETAYNNKLMELLNVKTKDEAAELMGTVQYLDASIKAQAFAQAEALKTSVKASQEAIRLQGKNMELSALVKADGKYSPEKVIAFRDAHNISHLSPEDVYEYYKLKHPQRDLAKESNLREQKRLSKIRILKKSRVLPKATGRLEDLTMEEAQDLIENHPDDPRVIAFSKKQNW